MAKSKEKGPGLLLISVGNMLASIMISGFLLGYWLDVWLETTPVFMLLFGALGFVGGFLKVFKLLTDPNLQ
ncbi:MAG: AtpZ/AtpI family protein [Gammaproteobacteria bacterium]|nr:AtpZ/AtpI family protein [Gammaproteobacteria bacterium]